MLALLVNTSDVLHSALDRLYWLDMLLQHRLVDEDIGQA